MVDTYDVVIATYNGELYLSEQLRSIECQSVLPSHVYIGDDGSTDQTITIITEWIKSSSIPVTYYSPSKSRLGSVRNFERLLSASKSSFVMLSDQDDVWHSDKAQNLLRYIKSLEKQYGTNTPLLAYSDLSVVDSDGNIISPSFFRYQHLNPKSNHWLSIGLQNIVPGCSSVVNRKCIQLSLPFPDNVIMHDWWLALVASSSGETTYYPDSTINYRQHANNVVGASSFSCLLIRRLSLFLKPSSIDKYIGEPILQLQACANRLKINNSSLSDCLADLTSSFPITRICAALRLGLKKHGIIRTIFFYILLFFWNPPSHHNFLK